MLSQCGRYSCCSARAVVREARALELLGQSIAGACAGLEVVPTAAGPGAVALRGARRKCRACRDPAGPARGSPERPQRTTRVAADTPTRHRWRRAECALTICALDKNLNTRKKTDTQERDGRRKTRSDRSSSQTLSAAHLHTPKTFGGGTPAQKRNHGAHVLARCATFEALARAGEAAPLEHLECSRQPHIQGRGANK